MDYKKTNAPLNTVTRDMIAMAEQTGNVYETVCIIGKRANQIAVEMKKELEKKLQEFASTDNMEEVSENREQIEISRFYEKLPKPTLIATQDYIEHKLYFANPARSATVSTIDHFFGIRTAGFSIVLIKPDFSGFFIFIRVPK